MRFVTISLFSVAGRLVTLATAKPIPNWSTSGMAIPLSRHSPDFLNSNKSIDLDAMSAHGISVREKILSGLENYEINTGTMHPFAVKRSEPGLRKRGAKLPLIIWNSYLWMAEISIGTPAKTLKVRIDSGSADLWVLQTGCSGILPEGRDLWDPHSSESAQKQPEGDPFRLRYGDGTIVEGDLYTDNVTIAGFTADPQTFGSATSFTSEVSPANEFEDGLLGLAFPSISTFRVSTPFASLYFQKKQINPVISLKLSRSGAEMYVGGANSMLYNGAITYIPITHPGYWQVSMDDVRYNGETIFENVPAILDTGSNYIYGDVERVSALYRRIGVGTLKHHHGFDFYYLPCDAFLLVSITFGGKRFAISPEAIIRGLLEEGSYNCVGTIIGDPKRDGFWVIGAPFLQSVYTVLDYGIAKIGFADLA